MTMQQTSAIQKSNHARSSNQWDRSDVSRTIGLLILATAIFYFRGASGSVVHFVLATLIVIGFWWLHSLRIARFNVRAFLTVLLLFGIPFVLLRQLPMFASNEVDMNPWTEESFDPAKMGSIHLSHQVALQVYFDHRPSDEERYFKSTSLDQTHDGMRYTTEVLRKNAPPALEPELMPKTRAWIEDHLKGKSREEKAREIEALIQNDFKYSLAPGALNSPHPLDEFLFDRKTGYCEHFAAAFTTMMKLSGERAHVVVGFQGGSWNPLTQELTYELADSHAWSEVYDPTLKTWKKYDPTAWVATLSERETSSAISSGSSYLRALTALLLIAFAILILTLSRSFKLDPFIYMTRKLERLERKNELTARGLTIQERIRRLALLDLKHSEHLLKSLDLYLLTYFAAEPTQEQKRSFRRSVAQWP